MAGASALGLVVGLGAASPASAQEGLSIEEVVVTARKFEESLQETPVAVTAYTAELIQARNMTDVRDLTNATPNLIIQTSGVNGSSQTPAVYLRGLGQADTVLTADPAVGIYVDGVYVARNVGSILNLVDLERIEVLRGPQGTLFGKNTIGGAISLVSKKPGRDFAAQAEATVGDYARWGAKASVNLPVGETLAFRLAAYANRQNGYIKLANYPGREYGDENVWAVRGQARWTPTEDLTVDLAVDYSSTRNTGAPQVLRQTFPNAATGFAFNRFYSGNPASCLSPVGQATNPQCFGPVQVPRDPYVSNARFFDKQLNVIEPTNKFDVAGVNLTIGWDLPIGHLQSISAYRNLRSDYTFDGGMFGQLFFQSTADRQDSDQYSEELQLSGSALSDKLNWIVGGYYMYEETFGHVDVLSPFITLILGPSFYPVLTDNHGDTQTYNVAAFGQATYDVADWLHVTGGLRWTREKKEASIVLLPQVPGGLKGELTVEKVTPLVSVSADVAPGVMVYASYSEGFRSGGFPPRIIGRFASFPTYGPESAASYELGVKADLFDRRVRANFAAFTTSFEDFQSFATLANPSPGDPGFGTVINAGDARIEGFELEATALLTRSLRLEASVSRLAAKVIRVDPRANEGGAPITSGRILPYSPPWKASLGLSWRHEFENGSELTARVDAAYTDLIYFSLGNTSAGSQKPVTALNAGLTYAFPDQHWEIVVAGKNLTDEYFFTSGGADTSVTGTSTGVLAPPRTLMATLRWKY
ncbi:MAG: TonB-dependent receptor [Phenylobacterium sp.]|uniref:TonB-dependent receptor n=1 Tax=Phenylobacterium sp. TaxID=1871053 RepID=UPI00273404FB|nr:TonB-dependent receptor [Phenylobacterium sp.]MDP3747648.1 TonB-dependent receptor [Phenylobacterium sp.]